MIFSPCEKACRNKDTGKAWHYLRIHMLSFQKSGDHRKRKKTQTQKPHTYYASMLQLDLCHIMPLHGQGCMKVHERGRGSQASANNIELVLLEDLGLTRLFYELLF